MSHRLIVYEPKLRRVAGTCAGMIMLADEVSGGALSDDPSGKAIGGFPFRVIRNQYGRQVMPFLCFYHQY